MKIRINDLARELEVKSKQILDVLIKVGVTEKKTHSSSVEADEAEKVRKYFQENSGAPNRHRAGGEEFRPKIDLSKISKPGDALKAILARKEPPVETVAPPPPPPAPPKAIVNKPSAPRPAPPVVPERVPRFVTPQSVAMRSQVSTVEMPKPPTAAVPPPPAPAAEVAAPPAPTPPQPPIEAPVAAASPEITVPETPVAVEPAAVPVDTAPAAHRLQSCAGPGRSRCGGRARLASCCRACQTCRPQAATVWVCPSTDAWPTARAASPPHDCAADGSASGLHRAAATPATCATTAFHGESRGSAGTWAADLPASSSRTIIGSCRCTWCTRLASADACWRASPHASHSHRSHSWWTPSYGWTSRDEPAPRWSAPSGWSAGYCRRCATSWNRTSSWRPHRRSCPSSRPTLSRSARQAGRTDEGVHAAAPAVTQQ